MNSSIDSAPSENDTLTTTTRRPQTEPLTDDPPAGVITGPDSDLIRATQNDELTLEPFVPARPRGGRRQRTHRQSVRRNPSLNLNEITPGEYRPAFKKFYVIKTVDGSSMAEIDVFQANREIERKLCGKPAKITETRAGTLIVEAKDEKQSIALSMIESLADVPVAVVEHERLNEIKGTIWYANQRRYTEEQILGELKPFGAKAIYQTKKKVNGTLIPQSIYIITFDTQILPSNVYLGWTKCQVRLYIPRPRRCFKCQGLRHGAASCRKEYAVCYNCAQEQHDLPCTRPALCANCSGTHPASSPNCPLFVLEEEILATQARERCSYIEAKRTVQSRNPRGTRTYSEAVRKDNHQRVTVDSGTARAAAAAASQQDVPSETHAQPVVVEKRVTDGSTQTEGERETPRETSSGTDQKKEQKPSKAPTSTTTCKSNADDLIIPIPGRKRLPTDSSSPDRSVRPKPSKKPTTETQQHSIYSRNRLASDTTITKKSNEQMNPTVQRDVLKAFPPPKNLPTYLPPSVPMRPWGESGRSSSNKPSLQPKSGADTGQQDRPR